MSDTLRAGWYERLTDAAKMHGTTRLKILLGNIASQTPQPSPFARRMMREADLWRLVEELERDLAAANADNARLQNDAETWRDAAMERKENVERFREENARLREALDEWREWASSSQCIYCGEVFRHDPINHEEADVVKKAHILVCVKHPYSATARLREALDQAIEWMTGGGSDRSNVEMARILRAALEGKR